MPRSRRTKRRVCVDTGGTFTDIVELQNDELTTRKALSTPSRPERAVLSGLHPEHGGTLTHGSTVGLNAVLTGRGARIALVTNRGFEDLIEIGRQSRPELYSRSVPPRPQLVRRSLRFGIAERRLASGELEQRATDEELEQLRTRLARSNVEGIAVCLLHAHEHPEDEQRIASALEPLGIPITCSAGLLRRHGEYERFSTAVINAFVAPSLGKYLQRLEDSCAPMELELVRNDGGTLPAPLAYREPARVLFSGPAGGVLAARFWGQRHTKGPIIAFDMGGTSADVAFCADSRDALSVRELAGHALALPTFPIASVGTGGGSIARRDEGGALRVGPESAGAQPGPACYGKGTAPTVTDAHLELGRMSERGLLGGAFALHPDRAHAALRALGTEFSMSSKQVSERILELADLQMARPLRAFTVGRGLDPAECTLVAFGGAGGLHAARLAESVGFGQVLVPPDAGVLSAMGMLLTGKTVELELAHLRELERGSARELQRTARTFLREVRTEERAIFGEARRSACYVAVRYLGQRSEFWVDADERAPEAFEEAFEARFGFRQELPLETLRLRARLEFAEVDEERIEAAFAKRLQERKRALGRATRQQLRPDGLPALPREGLPIGRWALGPLAVLDDSATTIVEEGWRVRLTRTGALCLVPAPS